MFNKVIDFFFHNEKRMREDRWIFSIVLVTAILALVAAFALSVDAIELVKNPSAQLSCSINSIINCATVGKTSYASMFGFPNSFIGLMVEPIFVVVAIMGLYRVKLPRQFMFGVQLASLISILFAYQLFFIGMFVIKAVCPWCLLVDVSTTIMFFAITRYNIREENLYLPRELNSRLKAFIQKDFDKLTAALIIVAAIAVMVIEFGKNLFAR